MRNRLDIVSVTPQEYDVFIHVNLVGEDVVREIENEIFDATSAGFRKMTLHLREVNYVSSAGLALLVKLHTKSVIGGGTLVLKAANPSILNLLELTKLKAIFTYE